MPRTGPKRTASKRNTGGNKKKPSNGKGKGKPKKKKGIKTVKDSKGYEYIVKAQEFQKNKKTKSAIKQYDLGIPLLENDVIRVQNSADKRKFRDRIQEYRQAKLGLENKLLKKGVKSGGAGGAMKKNVSRAKLVKPIEEEDGYKHIEKAMKLEDKGQLADAIKAYEKGIKMLEGTMKSIDRKADIEKRRTKIDGFRHRQQRCTMKLSEEKRVRKTVEIEREEIKPFEKEPGYSLCQKAIQYEKQKKPEIAIKYYQKGIPLLDEHLKSVDNSVERRARSKRIEEYRHNMQRLKNNKVRSGGNQPVLEGIVGSDADLRQGHRRKPSREARDMKIGQYNEAAVSRNSGKIKLVSVNSASRLKISTRTPNLADLSAVGGALFTAIRTGHLTMTAITKCERQDIYHMLPLVASSILRIPLPFLACVKMPLNQNFIQKIERYPLLEQRFRMFLYSYHSSEEVRETWGDHPSFPQVIQKKSKKIFFLGGNDDLKSELSISAYSAQSMTPEPTPSDVGLTEFEETYLDRDATWFFRTFTDREPLPNTIQDVPPDLEVYDPMGSDNRIHSIRVDKVFKSNAKPLLVTAHSKTHEQGSKTRRVSKFILKKGDDLRKDSGALHLFRYMNMVWSEANLFYDGYPVQTLIYKVLPMGVDFGALEFISDCIPLRDVAVYDGKFKAAHLKNLVASAAASYVASYVVGVRDRHFDNVLIRNDGTLFHIDFGFVMGETLALDTAKIAITKDLLNLFGKHWHSFVEKAVEAYMILRRNFSELLEYSQLVFAFAALKSDPAAFLRKRLQINVADDTIVEDKIRTKFLNAPSAFSTVLKNTVHNLATKLADDN